MVSIMSAQMPAAAAKPAAAAESAAPAGASHKTDDVPAPPMALLFGIGAVGLIWGRRLAANARKAREQAKPTE